MWKPSTYSFHGQSLMRLGKGRAFGLWRYRLLSHDLAHPRGFLDLRLRGCLALPLHLSGLNRPGSPLPMPPQMLLSTPRASQPACQQAMNRLSLLHQKIPLVLRFFLMQ